MSIFLEKPNKFNEDINEDNKFNEDNNDKFNDTVNDTVNKTGNESQSESFENYVCSHKLDYYNTFDNDKFF